MRQKLQSINTREFTSSTTQSTSVNTWKRKYKSNKENTLIKKYGRPNLLSDELLQKTKDIIIGRRSAGTVISRRKPIAIRTCASLFLTSFRAYIFHYFPFWTSLFYFHFWPNAKREGIISQASFHGRLPDY